MAKYAPTPVFSHQQSCTPNTGNGGNFYSFGAASAGRNVPDETDATSTICPKGWTLIGNNGNKSFINLTTTYLRISKNTEGLATTVEAALRAAPLSFVRSGDYYYSTSTLDARGGSGHCWSSRASNAANAYYLHFNSTVIRPQANNNKGYGFPVRCVAR